MSATAITVQRTERSPQAFRGWLPLIVLPATVVLLAPQAWPPWMVMWSLALAIYFGCKWLTWRRADSRSAPLWRQIAYLLAWPGLDADAFLRPRKRRPVTCPRTSEWSLAIGKLIVGLLTLSLLPIQPTTHPRLVGWIGMVGIVFTLHFGLFHILSCGWRSVGINAPPLMNWPICAGSVSDFWNRRWNRAFRDLTHRYLFLPVAVRCGWEIALIVGFLASGIVHDLVISVPSGGGYGRPTLYFLIQGLAILFERSRIGRRTGLANGIRGRLFAAAATMLPIGLLFPPQFIDRVMAPFLTALGVVL